MDLEAYLKLPNNTQEKLASKLGVSQGLVSQWVKSRTKITAERAVEIEKATGNKVKRHELRPDIFGDSV